MAGFDVVVTGAAGFIGSHFCDKLRKSGLKILALDSLKPVYSSQLQSRRLDYFEFEKDSNITFLKFDLASCHVNELAKLISGSKTVVHLAASPGVRRSLQHPDEYSSNNIVGFSKIVDAVNSASIPLFFYASSSSVYGNRIENKPMVENSADGQNLASYYATTKWTNELIAKNYPFTTTQSCALRFFTVYGAWGRPDMAYFSFANKIVTGEPIEIFNNGNLTRDFTYISDLIYCLEKLVLAPQTPNLRLPTDLNFGLGRPNSVSDLVAGLEYNLGRKANLKFVAKPTTDVDNTCSDPSLLKSIIGDLPETTFSDGLAKFSKWFSEYVVY